MNKTNRKIQWKLLDNYRRKLFLKSEIKKKILHGILNNQSLPLIYRYLALWNKNKITRLRSVTLHQNRCTKTGRNRSTLKTPKYSRFFFRTESYKGDLPGFSRASW